MKNFIKSTWKKYERYCLPALFLTVVLLSAKCVSQEKPQATFERDSIITAAREIVGSQKYCALATIDSLGIPHVRTMNPFPPEEDMSVWMATNSRSDKVQQIRNNSRVCLYYADHSKATGYVAITGRAVLVDDMAEKLKRKRDYWTQAFPDWQYLLLIKVIPEKLEVINYRHGMMNGSVTWSVPSINFQKP
jgi:general stress protein 26